MILHGGEVGPSSINVGDIGHSLRLRKSATAYLSKTLAAPTDGKKWVFSAFVKRGIIGAAQMILRGVDGVANANLAFDSTDDLYFGAGATIYRRWSPLFRDPSAPYHIVLVCDTTQATEANRLLLYINGVQQTTNGTNAISQNSVFSINKANAHYIGGESSTFDGYMSRVCFVDGQALTPSSFGYLNTEINEWVSKSQSAVKAVVDAGGTNSFMLDFDNGTSLTTLGYDKSAKGNNWTLNNVSLTAGSTYDWMLDVPGNSYATFNPLSQVTTNSSATTGSANLYISSGSANYSGFPATLSIPTTGKWGIKFKVGTVSGSNDGSFGVACDVNGNARTGVTNADTTYWYTSVEVESFYYRNVKHKYSGGSVVTDLSGGAGTGTSNDEYEFLINRDAGTILVKLNGTTISTVTGVPSTNNLFPYVTVYNTTGYFTFDYTPSDPSYKALSQANLADNEAITTSGTFTGNLTSDGPYVDLKGTPTSMTINGNSVTFGTHADKTAFGFKVRSASSSYNNTGSNTYSITSTGPKRKYALAKANP